MNRCLSFLRTCAPWLLLLVLSGGFAGAQAQIRQFPQGAKAGTLVVTTPPEVTLDGKPMRLAPGVRIMGPDNMQIMSGALAGRTVVVAYLRDAYGLLMRVWLLNPDEIQAARENLKPLTNFSFGSSEPPVRVDDGKTPFDQLPKYRPRP